MAIRRDVTFAGLVVVVDPNVAVHAPPPRRLPAHRLLEDAREQVKDLFIGVSAVLLLAVVVVIAAILTIE